MTDTEPMLTNENSSTSGILQRHVPLYLLLAVTVNSELDVIASRLRARQIAMLCGFSGNEQARVATAVSELARDAAARAMTSEIKFFLGTSDARQTLIVVVEGQKPTFETSNSVKAGSIFMHDGLSMARRFMDDFNIVGDGVAASVIALKNLPTNRPLLLPEQIVESVKGLAKLPDNVALSESQQQNRELTLALATLQAKQNELLDVSANLERTNEKIESLNIMLKEKADSLMSADRRKDEFLSILSHELRGPLSAAGMAASLLENGNHGDQSVRLGQLVARQVGHMSRLVEDLLDVSRVSRGLVSIDQLPVDLRDIVDAAVEQLASAAASKKHVVARTLPAYACIVNGDRTRLLQIVANLLGNAIRYTPDGGQIDLAVEGGTESVVIKVSDNGIGISDKLMPHLFDLYTQAERSTDARNSGLGLGLALVKSLAEAHGGTVTAYSAGAGCGSQFEIILPVAEVRAQGQITTKS